jgi:hypothetical protein
MIKEDPYNPYGYFNSKYVDKKSHALEHRQLRARLNPRIFSANKNQNQTADCDYGPDADACPLPDMSEEDLEMAKDQYLELLKFEDRNKIEQETKGQSSSTGWKEQCRKRFTAFMFRRNL